MIFRQIEVLKRPTVHVGGNVVTDTVRPNFIALSVVAFLAANGDMEPEIVERLQVAARELGYQ